MDDRAYYQINDGWHIINKLAKSGNKLAPCAPQNTVEKEKAGYTHTSELCAENFADIEQASLVLVEG